MIVVLEKKWINVIPYRSPKQRRTYPTFLQMKTKAIRILYCYYSKDLAISLEIMLAFASIMIFLKNDM